MPKSIKIDLPEALADRLEAAGIRGDEAERMALAALAEAIDRPDLRARWNLAAAEPGRNPPNVGQEILSEEEIEQARREYAQVFPPPGPAASLPSASAAVPHKPSWLAAASFVIGLLGLPAWFIVFGLAAYSQMEAPDTRTAIQAVVGLSAILGLIINVGALVAGIVAWPRKASNAWMAVAGVVLNALQIAAIVGIFALGISVSRSRSLAARVPAAAPLHFPARERT